VIALSKLIFFSGYTLQDFFLLRGWSRGRLRAEVPRAERLTRFNYDVPLITAFMDRWRPETHTFHFPVGEMTLSLEDAAMLGGLPCAGQAMGPIDIPATWQTDYLARFANVPRNDRALAPYAPFVDPHRSTWTWI
jgi:hypothetical protein